MLINFAFLETEFLLVPVLFLMQLSQATTDFASRALPLKNEDRSPP